MQSRSQPPANPHDCLVHPCAAYCQTMMQMPAMQEWIAGAMTEPDELEELDVEF